MKTILDELNNGYAIAKDVIAVVINKRGRRISQEVVQYQLLNKDNTVINSYPSYQDALEKGMGFVYDRLPRGGQAFMPRKHAAAEHLFA